MNKMNLLLIDDDEDDRELFEYALRSVTPVVEFSFATCGRSAINKLKEATTVPDVIFLDMNMPGMDGCECLAAMRQLPHLKQVPMVVYSSRSSNEYEQRALALQANHFLVKPYRTDELTGVLNELLTGKQLPFLLQPMATK